MRRDADPRRCVRLPGARSCANQLLAILPRALQAGQAKQDDRQRGQLGLFDVFEAASHAPGANGNGKARPCGPR